jgi:sulfite reductase alpha subunit-like flavoprotein
MRKVPAATTAAANTFYVLYGSETGHGEQQARVLQRQVLLRDEAATVKCVALNDVDLTQDLPKMHKAIFIVSTCGQGDIPHNARAFWAKLQDNGLPANYLTDLRFAVFGLGDSEWIAESNTQCNRYHAMKARLFSNPFYCAVE